MQLEKVKLGGPKFAPLVRVALDQVELLIVKI